MKESIGYTATLNIIIIFIVVIFTFLSAALIYFKSNKVSNMITNSVEKYEGYNTLAETEITRNLASIGYNRKSITCAGTVEKSINAGDVCVLVSSSNGNANDTSNSTGQNGYCIYVCDEGDYYYYKIRINMMLNIPIINDILNIPIFSNTNRLFDFQEKFG